MKINNEKVFVISMNALIWLVSAVLGFAVMSGSVFLLSKCFGFTFSWKLAFGAWIVYLIVYGLFKAASRKD